MGGNEQLIAGMTIAFLVGAGMFGWILDACIQAFQALQDWRGVQRRTGGR